MSIFRCSLLCAGVAVAACVMFALDHKEPPAHMTINELYRAASFHDGVEKIYQGFRR